MGSVLFECSEDIQFVQIYNLGSVFCKVLLEAHMSAHSYKRYETT